MNEKAANLLRIAVNNSDRLVRLINDILDLERMQSGRAPLSFRACSLSELAQQAIEAVHTGRRQRLRQARPARPRLSNLSPIRTACSR